MKEQDKKLHQEIIRIRDNINFKIGLLLAAKTGVCTPLAESEKIEASLIKKYERINPTVIKIRAEYMEI